ncbi:hypothetical protein HK101_002816 [Irineochytrium annulatum]|nr:hypothetical protein HK101_002816 [Irineochytrium annulatum]
MNRWYASYLAKSKDEQLQRQRRVSNRLRDRNNHDTKQDASALNAEDSSSTSSIQPLNITLANYRVPAGNSTIRCLQLAPGFGKTACETRNVALVLDRLSPSTETEKSDGASAEDSIRATCDIDVGWWFAHPSRIHRSPSAPTGFLAQNIEVLRPRLGMGVGCHAWYAFMHFYEIEDPVYIMHSTAPLDALEVHQELRAFFDSLVEFDVDPRTVRVLTLPSDADHEVSRADYRATALSSIFSRAAPQSLLDIRAVLPADVRKVCFRQAVWGPRRDVVAESRPVVGQAAFTRFMQDGWRRILSGDRQLTDLEPANDSRPLVVTYVLSAASTRPGNDRDVAAVLARRVASWPLRRQAVVRAVDFGALPLEEAVAVVDGSDVVVGAGAIGGPLAQALAVGAGPKGVVELRRRGATHAKDHVKELAGLIGIPYGAVDVGAWLISNVDDVAEAVLGVLAAVAEANVAAQVANKAVLGSIVTEGGDEVL